MACQLCLSAMLEAFRMQSNEPDFSALADGSILSLLSFNGSLIAIPGVQEGSFLHAGTQCQ